MKKFLGFCCLGMLMLPTAGLALEGEVDSVTLVDIHNSSTPGFGERLQAPVYEFFRTDLQKDNLFLNFYGWGSVNISDINDRDGHVETGYIGYRFPKANGVVKAGRFYQFAETGVEHVDGVFMRTDLAGGFALQGYGGAPVRVDFDNKGDYIYGGKLSWKYPKILDVGISALREGGARTITDWDDGPSAAKNRRDLAGANVWFSPHKMVEATGDGTYNLITNRLQEQRYMLMLHPADNLDVSGEFKEERFEGYFASTSLPVFPPEPGKLKSYTGSLNVRPSKATEISGFYRHYEKKGFDNDVASTEDFDRYGVQTRLKVGKSLSGLQYMRADADDAEYRYHQVYVFTEYKMDKIKAHLNLQVDFYDRGIYERAHAIYAGPSLSYKLTQNLGVTGKVIYNRNPHYDDSVSGYVWLTYNAKL